MTLSVRIYVYISTCFMTHNSTNSWCAWSLCCYRVSLVNYRLTVLVLALKHLMLPEVLLQFYKMCVNDQNRLDPTLTQNKKAATV